jgi:hypothetical protein
VTLAQGQAARAAAVGWMWSAVVGVASVLLALVPAIMRAPWAPGTVYALVPVWLVGRALTRARTRRRGSRTHIIIMADMAATPAMPSAATA